MKKFLIGFLMGIITLILIQVLIPLGHSCASRAYKAKTYANMSVLGTAIDEYIVKFGNLPTNGTNLVNTLLDEGLIEKPIRDSWGNFIILEQTEYSLISVGADGKLGTTDDHVTTK